MVTAIRRCKEEDKLKDLFETLRSTIVDDFEGEITIKVKNGVPISTETIRRYRFSELVGE